MISSLRLLNFRCFEQLSLQIPAAGAIFTGDNAQGKTSILEAICLLIRLHSPRTRLLSHLIRFQQTGFGIAGDAWQKQLQIRHQKQQGITLKIDNYECDSQREYLNEGGLLVWMANEDIQLIRGAGSVRRRYLDFLGCQLTPDYRRCLAAYKKALKARNHLLKKAQLDARSLQAYNKTLATYGSVLIQQRQQLVSKILPLAQQFHSAIGSAHEALGIQYRCDPHENLLQRLQDNLERDRQRGNTLAGPHRDDLVFYLNDKPVNQFGSEGQQRTLAIALKLAQGKVLQEQCGRLPIYLIDDVFGELDPQRRHALVNHLPRQAQTLITTTTLDWLQESPAIATLSHLQKFTVNQAHVTQNPSSSINTL